MLAIRRIKSRPTRLDAASGFDDNYSLDSLFLLAHVILRGSKMRIRFAVLLVFGVCVGPRRAEGARDDPRALPDDAFGQHTTQSGT